MSAASRVIYIGYDPREAVAFAIAKHSIRRFDRTIPIHGLVLDEMRRKGLYTRETKSRINGEGHLELVDVASIAPDYNGRISTEHANARFLVPLLEREGWALFVDCDVMFLANPNELFDLADPSKAIMVVHHDYEPDETSKMDGQVQTKYARKNQSSVMLINCAHPAHRKLTLKGLNTLPGRCLHRFYWLDDEDIGELPPEWNYLVGVTKLPVGVKPKLVHFTRGLPDMPGYELQEYAGQWQAMKPYAVGAL